VGFLAKSPSDDGRLTPGFNGTDHTGTPTSTDTAIEWLTATEAADHLKIRPHAAFIGQVGEVKGNKLAGGF
jgi:hypothetical protein